MYKQLEIFDFIEKLSEPDTRSLLEGRFGKIDSPVIQCINCLCNRCVNNVEELWSKVLPDEQKEPCFNCDECCHYTGGFNYKSQRKEDCEKFEISDYAAEYSRKNFKIVKKC